MADATTPVIEDASLSNQRFVTHSIYIKDSSFKAVKSNRAKETHSPPTEVQPKQLLLNAVLTIFVISSQGNNL
jgi:hypothetical protein